ncbi:acylphosphatase [Ensifer soli]|uniref:acylphosphatase n=1 Tax=Ciceribacter sp. sgz301302 TaxID=3342379 RepID=UPI0035B7A905
MLDETRQEAAMTGNGAVRQRMTIHGALGVPSFLPWVKRHAARLGLEPAIVQADAACVMLDLDGDAALIDMLEVGCSLGPFEAWVETIERRPIDPPAA